MYIIIAAVGVAIVYVVFTYNALASLRNRARNAWADVDVQLKRRYDLVPNLVAAVQGYASHEKSVFEDVANLRAKAAQLDGIGEKAGAESDLSGAIKSIFAIAESYPDLKADANFHDLQTQLTEIEDHIQYARRYYNAVVRDINIKCEMFPSNLIAGWFGFGRQEYFGAADDERESPHIKMEER
ncbi:LemA family protein [bacterium]|nr:LemA family protein [bacterium]